MQDQTAYLLQFNNEVLLASVNLSVMYNSLCARCRFDKIPIMDQYATVRRRIMAEGKYVLEPKPGYRYSIIERSLVKKAIQNKIPFIKETEVKQSNG